MDHKIIKKGKFKIGSIFYVPFMNSDSGVFGYVNYDASTRKNPLSLDLSLCDIYDHICGLNEWSDDIKQSQIKISDMIINKVFFPKLNLI